MFANMNEVYENNNSGMGERCNQFPIEIEGKWNWGAFLLPIPWGIGNRVYQTLLCLIPIVGIFASFYFGSNGNKLAWKHKCWDSVEDFRRVQRKWAAWAVGVNAVVLAVYISSTIATNKRIKEADELHAMQEASVIAAMEQTGEYKALVEGRVLWDKGNIGMRNIPGEQFFFEENAYRAWGSLTSWNPSMQSETDPGFFYFGVVEYSDGRQWTVECQTDSRFQVTSIAVEEDPTATKQKQSLISAYRKVETDQQEYLERITAEITNSGEWREAIGPDYEFVEGFPVPANANYENVYSGGDAEFEGFYAEVEAHGKRYSVEKSDNGSQYDTDGKLVIAELESEAPAA